MKTTFKLRSVRRIFTHVGVTPLVILSGHASLAQSIDTLRIPHYSVPFLTFAPDARSAGMGEAGVASSVDANSTYWNVSKLAFAERDFGASVSYTPWLRSLVDNMWLGYASAYRKLGKGQAVATSVKYFTQGNIDLYTQTGAPNGAFHYNDLAVSGSYAAQLGRNFSLGLTLKYIATNNSPYVTIVNRGPSKSAKGLAGDLGFYYRKQQIKVSTGREVTWSLGATISNFGGKINYGELGQPDFIPTALKIGAGLSIAPNKNHRFNLITDISKLMVPTPRSGQNVSSKPLLDGIFGSFSDAPGGLKEEVQEIALSVGGEYWYKSMLALRGGYFHEDDRKGGVEHLTAGAGLRLFRNYQADFSYSFPVGDNSPLAKTMRISISAYLGKKRAS